MIRLATMSDLDQIDQIAVRVIEDMSNSNIPQWDMNYPRKSHYQKDVENHSLFVYELNDKVIGAIVIIAEDDPPYETISGWSIRHGDSMVIHRLVVDPTYRKQGIAQAFLDFAKEMAHELGFQSIKIDTHHDNYKMRSFLEKNEFHYIGYLEVINREAYELVLEESL